MMTWDNMSAQSWRVLTYLKINPMYYWMNTCSYNMVNHLEINILLYFVGTVIITEAIEGQNGKSIHEELHRLLDILTEVKTNDFHHLEVTNLSKSFDPFQLHNISFTCQRDILWA